MIKPGYVSDTVWAPGVNPRPGERHIPAEPGGGQGPALGCLLPPKGPDSPTFVSVPPCLLSDAQVLSCPSCLSRDASID